ncbi:MAG: hypothetical protein M3071_25540 [Actinomycetota bacterium]|nr:hypothetical protein [Actinomycetota bacterium]
MARKKAIIHALNLTFEQGDQRDEDQHPGANPLGRQAGSSAPIGFLALLDYIGQAIFLPERRLRDRVEAGGDGEHRAELGHAQREIEGHGPADEIGPQRARARVAMTAVPKRDVCRGWEARA